MTTNASCFVCYALIAAVGALLRSRVGIPPEILDLRQQVGVLKLVRKGRVRWVAKDDTSAQTKFIDKFFAITV